MKWGNKYMDRQPLHSCGPRQHRPARQGHYKWTIANLYEIEENNEVLLMSGGVIILDFHCWDSRGPAIQSASRYDPKGFRCKNQKILCPKSREFMISGCLH